MEPENNPTPGASPQPETPDTGNQPEPTPETPAPETEQSPVQPAEPAPVAAVTEWPGAFGVFKRAAAATKVNLVAILLFNLVTILFSGADRNKGGLLTFVSLLVSIWASISLTSLYLASVRGQKQSFGDAAQVGFKRYVDGFIEYVVTVVLLMLSFVALIVPFFFVLPRLQFVMYYVVDKGMGPIDAIQASWADSKGFSLKVWGVLGVSILFGVLCVLIVGIYLLFMYQTALALLYLYATGKKDTAAAQPAVEPAAPTV
jgi:hypothetical protein